MIQIIDKKDCCGCNACVQRCPKQCITMHADNEGFLYPIVDTTQCTDCGLCEKVCPVINQNEPHKPLNVYAAYNRNEEIRMVSSSGGIFTLLAEETIKKGGVVFGVKFNRDWMTEYGYTETIEGIAPFRGSKYVQAIVGDAYKQAEEFLKAGREVLFSGTPCQISALKGFLRKEYENLTTVDIICHGVPSPKIWDKYLKETYDRYTKNYSRDKVASHSEIEAINFRNKNSGWKRYSIFIKFKTPALAKEGDCILSEPAGKNAYMKAMLDHLTLRPSCHSCKSKNGRSRSDITIADFWGISKYNQEIDDNNGTSAVLTNTIKGEELFKKADCVSNRQTYEQITTEVTTYYRSVEPHPKREQFFNEIDKRTLHRTIDKYKTRPVKRKKSFIKKIIKKYSQMGTKLNKKVIYDSPGQTCNRLWSYLDTIGWAIKTNSKVKILFWDKDIIHFDRLRKNPYVKFPLYNKTFVKWLGDKRYLKIVRKIFANGLVRPHYKNDTSGKYIKGWTKRADSNYFPDVIDKIKEIYTPNDYVTGDVTPIIEKYRNEGFFIVGVHIRRGDYKTWEGGRYYFEHEEYAKHMDDVARLYSDKKICFAISTNEKYDPEVFKRFTICELKNTTAIHDLYTLSLCDRIIGPLSTFSRWASFYGNVPLCFISREMNIEKEEDFSVIKDFYHFENGVEIINLTDKQQ